MAYLLIKMNLTLRVARRRCSPEIPERPEIIQQIFRTASVEIAPVSERLPENLRTGLERYGLILRIVGSQKIGRAERIDVGLDHRSAFGRSRKLLLRAAFGLHALFFLPLHFFLALLERRFRGCHRISLNFARQKSCRASGKSARVLPARFARLSRAIAVILV